MESVYYLWHCQRQGWVTKNGTTSTVFADAQRFARDVAIARAKRQVLDGTPALVPVISYDAEELLQ